VKAEEHSLTVKTPKAPPAYLEIQHDSVNGISFTHIKHSTETAEDKENAKQLFKSSEQECTTLEHWH